MHITIAEKQDPRLRKSCRGSVSRCKIDGAIAYGGAQPIASLSCKDRPRGRLQ
ncbi:hypothetical protein [Scytonema sp. HK-05]|uniref:hypothetical protein n=1 Tax=Scytonema sp. HK-05 TaxID=1137095 RepID=UPI00130106C8|nr:hypothetical protein [Scytonema sp. HK-05]